MKIRTGFVSNSSSSSFIILMKKEDYKEFYKSLEPKLKKIIKSNDLGCCVNDLKHFNIDLKEINMSGMDGDDWMQDIQKTASKFDIIKYYIDN